MSDSRPSTRWSRFSMCASTAPMPSSTRVRLDSKLAVRSSDFTLGFGITGPCCSSCLQPCCDDSILVTCNLSTPKNAKKALIYLNSQRIDESVGKLSLQGLVCFTNEGGEPIYRQAPLQWIVKITACGNDPMVALDRSRISYIKI
ncbi:hypothetical protein M9H77_08441 [Catharanthus roseus]|uniref:Uncharacterized protein n=1 Tax=Catharanthus roseus TaxID=4058 RepID=A0ACC0BXU1_CATRO|nr:hypothetical protein M9H77_08441 [Catharanthus roseus]